MREWELAVLPWEAYPLGTKARCIEDERFFVRVEGGWKWENGEILEAPGISNLVLLPESAIHIDMIKAFEMEMLKVGGVELSKDFDNSGMPVYSNENTQFKFLIFRLGFRQGIAQGVKRLYG